MRFSYRAGPSGVYQNALGGFIEPTDSSGLVAIIPNFAVAYGSGSSISRTYGEYQQSFTSTTGIFLGGLFDEEYEYYMGVIRYTVSTGAYLVARLTEGNEIDYYSRYKYQWLYAFSSTLTTNDADAEWSLLYGGYTDSTTRPAMAIFHIHGPYDPSSTTAIRVFSSTPYNNSWNDIWSQASLDNAQSDGMYIFPTAGTITGTISWYAMRG